MVEYITYKKTKYPVRISYMALKHFRQEAKELYPENSVEINDSMDLGLFEILLYFAMLAGHHALDQEMVLERKDMEYVLDESLTEFIGILSKMNAPVEQGGSPSGEDAPGLQISTEKETM